MYLSGLTGGISKENESEFTKKLLEKAGILGNYNQLPPQLTSKIPSAAEITEATNTDNKSPEEEKLNK